MEQRNPNKAYQNNKNSKSNEGNIVVNEILTDSQDFSKNIGVINIEHREVHKGNAYKFFKYVNVTNGSQNKNFTQIKTGDKTLHFVINDVIDGQQTFIVDIIEAPMLTDGTTPIQVFNCNRNSENITSVNVFANPTSVSGGTIIDKLLVPGDRQGGSEDSEINKEWNLKPNTDYVISMENIGNQSANILLKCFWYEV